jgi:hypothetical protein
MFRLVLPRLVAWSALAFASLLLISCGNGNPASSSAAQPIPNIAGPWEFVAHSSGGWVTGMEVALTEGSTVVNGVSLPDGAISASSDQVAFVDIDASTLLATGFGGSNCVPDTSATGFGPGSITALNAPITFSFTENGNVFNVTGTLSGDGKSVLNGTYTAQAGNTCADSGGTITGTAVNKLAGIYMGSMCPPSIGSCSSSSDFTDSVTATLSENLSSVLTITLVLTGTDNSSFTLSGPVTGNAFSIQGTFGGQTLTYDGYSEIVSNASALYLQNVTNSTQPNYVGTLSIP